MCFCETSKGSNDKEKRPEILNGFTKLSSLKFSNYEKYGYHKKLTENSIYLSYFDKEKLSIKKNSINELTYDIFYNGEPFRIALKSLLGVVKKSKFYKDKKIIKVMKNPFASKQLCCVFNAIKNQYKLNTFCVGNVWFLDCYKVIIVSDNELPCNYCYTFEDVVIIFDQIILTDNDFYGKDYRIISSLIEPSVKLSS